MLTADFDFELPDELIAQRARARGSSRLLTVAASSLADRSIADLPELLDPRDVLVLNNTRVIPARLFGRRADSGGRVELLLVRRLASREWLALARPGRRTRAGTRLTFHTGLEAVVESADKGQYRLRFSAPVEPHLAELGHVPLPPYIKRPDDAADRERYQTVYASVDGAVAAPTAGLHFTPELLDRIRERGVEVAELTLHVGIGTFKPMRTALVHEHRMDEEVYEVPAAVVAAVAEARRRGGRVVAVGTTVVRALESAARDGELGAGAGSTELFIRPGFEFRVVDRLLTNFHLPRSTLLILVCAFAGRERLLAAYRHAIAERYRFYSYGDAMLLDRVSGPSGET